MFGLVAQMNHQRGIASVVHNQVGAFTSGKIQCLQSAPPIVFEGFAFPGKNRHTGRGDGRSGVILSGIDIATGPANFCSEGGKSFDQYSRLDGHM